MRSAALRAAEDQVGAEEHLGEAALPDQAVPHGGRGGTGPTRSGSADGGGASGRRKSLSAAAGDAASTAFDLFSGGSYTEYGITLQSEAPAPVESGPDEDSGDPALFDTIANVLGTTEDTIALKPDEL